MPYPLSTVSHQTGDVWIHPHVPPNTVLNFRDAGGDQQITVSGGTLLSSVSAGRASVLAQMRVQDAVGVSWPVIGTPHQQAIHKLAPAAFYDLGSDNGALDGSATARNLTAETAASLARVGNTPSIVPGKSDTATAFSSTGGQQLYRSVGGGVGFNFAILTAGATLACWARADALSAPAAANPLPICLYDLGNGRLRIYLQFIGTTKAVRVGCQNNAGTTFFFDSPANTVVVGEVAHWCGVVLTSGRINIYKNATLVAQSALGTVPAIEASTGGTPLIASTLTGGYTGVVDQAAVWGSALTGAQVISINTGSLV